MRRKSRRHADCIPFPVDSKLEENQMTVERVAHSDLEPTFRSTPGVTGRLRSGRNDWSMLGVAFVLGAVCGALLLASQGPARRAVRQGRDLLREKTGRGSQAVGSEYPEGPHAPFDPRTRDANLGIGALAEQQYRSLEESRELEEVTEASEESFPASDPPSWSGVTIGRCPSDNSNAC